VTTARDIVGRALQRLRIIASGEAVPAHLAADALSALNAMIASWPAQGVYMHTTEFALSDEFWFFVPTETTTSATIRDLDYQGGWNASTDTPSLANAVGDRGDMYRVTVAGTTTLGTLTPWVVGDVIVSDGNQWRLGHSSARFHRAVIDLLAVEIAPNNGREASTELQRAALRGWRTILAAFIHAPPTSFDRALIMTTSRQFSDASTLDPDFNLDGGDAS
jgi:hypothetical protein